MPAPSRVRLLARLLVASATVVACKESSEASSTGERQNGQGGSAQAGSGGSSQAGSAGSAQAGSGQAGSGGSAQAGQGGSAQGGQSGCAGQAPTCELKCSDAWPPATCQGGEWVCPPEPADPDCHPMGGPGPGGAGGAGGSEQAGAAGEAGAAGSGPLPPCADSSITTCDIVACYPRTPGEICLDPGQEGLADKLGCTPNTPYPFYLSTSDQVQCCYGVACPGGRPLLVEGSLTHAAVARRSGWG